MTARKKATRRRSPMPQHQPFRLESRTVRSLGASSTVTLGVLIEALRTDPFSLGTLLLAVILLGQAAGIYYRVNRRAA